MGFLDLPPCDPFTFPQVRGFFCGEKKGLHQRSVTNNRRNPSEHRQDESSTAAKYVFHSAKPTQKNHKFIVIHSDYGRPIGVGMKRTKYAEPTGTQQDEKQTK